MPECGDAAAEVKQAEAPAPQPAVEPEPAPAPVAAPVPQSIELKDIEFALNSAVIADSAKPELDRMAEAIKSDPTITAVKVIGHTDSAGSAAYNKALSKRRAEAVAAYLRDHGVQVPVTSEGRGEAEPIADNRTAEGRARNRRVELEITR
ncbi:MAG: OmpA family protein [Gammaproteobacteria bacterium]|nr:MAG: OmpA family protein [Gammaproteobacteria bacterium]